MNINYKEMQENDAKKYFREAYRLFRKAINNNKYLFDYNLPFDWSIIEERHKENVCNEIEGCDFYFIDNIDKDDIKFFSIDISHNIEDFGYNSNAYKSLYNDIYEDLYCCDVCTYRDCFDYNDRLTEATFLFDKKNNKVVEVLDIAYYYRNLGNNQTIGNVQDMKKLERIIN